MKTATERLKWLIDFTEAFESTQELQSLKDWQRLRLIDEIREFIGGPDDDSPIEWMVKQGSGEAAPLSTMDISLAEIANLRNAAGFGIGEFTDRGPGVKVMKPIRRGSNFVHYDLHRKDTEVAYLFKPSG